MDTIAVNDKTQAEAEKKSTVGGESCSVYPPIGSLNCELFQLSNTPLTDECQQKALEELEKYLKEQQANFLGFQANQKFNYSEKLSFLLDLHSNNIGDPFENGSFTVNTKIMERAVLDYFAKLWHAVTPSNKKNPESYWGYILSMGSTEGNLYGLYNARDYLKGKDLYLESNGDLSYIRPVQKEAKDAACDNAYHPIAFFSEDTHYSIIKAVRTLEIRTFYEVGEKHYKGQCPITSDGCWPKEVPSENGGEGPGSIDVEKLTKLVEFFAKTGSPPLIILNLGTTFKGAYDDVEKVGKSLKPILEKYNLYNREVKYAPGKSLERTGFWIHVDGALGASYLPFLKKAGDRVEGHIPKFDFSLPFVHSMVVSAHKYTGCPMTGGIYMTKCKYQIKPPDDPEYIGAHDTTFAGSRNGMSSAVLWSYYANTSDEKEIDKALKVEDTAKYAETKLKELDKSFGNKLLVARSPLALTIRFLNPGNEDVIRKYSLSKMTLQLKDRKEPTNYVHIFVMQSVTKSKIDELVEDLKHAYDELFRQEQEHIPERPTRISETNEETDGIQRVAYVPLDNRGFSGN